jgi:hypothetical protein
MRCSAWWKVFAAGVVFSVVLAGSVCPAEEEDGLSFGIYITREKETLRQIAKHPEVYNGGLLWPLVYYLNVKELGPLLKDPAKVPDTPLPSGLNLAVIPVKEARSRAQKQGVARPFAVNVRSAKDFRDLDADAARLMNHGYYVYYTINKTNKVKWRRLRAGFFADKAEAEREIGRIRGIVKVDAPWAEKAEAWEILLHAGYLL